MIALHCIHQCGFTLVVLFIKVIYDINKELDGIFFSLICRCHQNSIVRIFDGF